MLSFQRKFSLGQAITSEAAVFAGWALLALLALLAAHVLSLHE